MTSLLDAEPVAKYLQLRRILESEISAGRYAVGEKVCTEAELVKRYNVSVNTVIRALKDLERAGMVVRKRGKGTFLVAHRPVQSAQAVLRTLFLAGRDAFAPEHMLPHRNLTWFIGYELHRGIINSFDGRVRMVTDEELRCQAPLLSPEERCAILVNPKQEMLDFLAAERIPFAFVEQKPGIMVPRPNMIGKDAIRGVCEGIAYLVQELGHRDIAFITTGGLAPHPDRAAGYSIALRAFDIPYREELVIKVMGEGNREAGYRAMKELIASGTRFTAAFVDTDIKALGALEALKEAGRRVPEDVSILGFDDVPGVDQADPPLTTVRVPYVEMGMEAVRLLEERMAQNGADVPGRLLSTRLVVRRSCAACRRE